MKCCLEIYLIDTLGIDDTFKDGDGFVMLDVDEGISINSSLEGVSEYNKLKGINSKDITLKSSRKNDYILEFYKSVSVEGKYENIRVDAYMNGELLPFHELVILNTEIVNNTLITYSAKLVNDSTNWKKSGNELLLSDIDMGTFDFTQANVISAWASGNSHIYKDGDSGVFFSHIDFGWYPDSIYRISYLRPLISPLHILRAGFCKLGYKFRSPILESQYMRDIWLYILSGNIGVYDGVGTDYAVIADDDSEIVINEDPLNPHTQIIDFINEIQDNGNKWSSPFYNNNDNSKIKIEIEIENETPGIFRIYSNNGTFIGGTSSGYGTFYTSVQGLIYVQLEIPAGYGDTFIGHRKITITPSDNKIYLGDTIKINQLIDKKYTFTDLVKGFIDAFSLKVVTNYVEKTVAFYHETEVKLRTGETPESFFRRKPDALEIDCSKVKISFEENKSLSNIVYAWKESTDGYITYEELEKDTRLYSREVVFNKDENGKSKMVENNLFEPTIMRPFLNKYDNVSLIVSSQPDVDGNFDATTGEVQARILRALPVVANSSGIYEGGYLAVTTMNGEEVGFNVYQNLVFGYNSDDIFTIFLKNKHKRLISKKVNAKIELTTNELINFDFRQKFLISEQTGSYEAYVDRIISAECNSGLIDSTIIPIETEVCSSCSEPCDCVVKRCLFYTDYNPTLFPDSIGTITSFIVNGVQQLSNPIHTPSPLSYITLYGKLYYTAFVDLLNSIGVEGFVFEYGMVLQGANYMNVTYPICYTWEIRHSINSGLNSSFVINQDGVWYDNNGTLTPILYDRGIPLSCVTYNTEDPQGACINTPLITNEVAYIAPQATNSGPSPNNYVHLIYGVGYVDSVVSDVLEYIRPDMENIWKPITNNSIPLCEGMAFIGFSYELQYPAGFAIVSLNYIQNCDGGFVEKIEYIYGNGTSQVFTNITTHSLNFAIYPGTWDSWNHSIIIKISSTTPMGVVYRQLHLTSNGPLIQGALIAQLSNIKKGYHITVRRTVTYSSCPQDTITKVIS